MNKRTQGQLTKVAMAAGMSSAELRDMIEAVVGEYLGDAPRQRRTTRALMTRPRDVFGEGHASVSYIADPEGTDILPPGHEPPSGYRGPYRMVS
jgi:hypothetical protein